MNIFPTEPGKFIYYNPSPLCLDNVETDGHEVDEESLRRMREFESWYGAESAITPTYGCEHDWKKYVGLTETYKFCTKCDEKDMT